MDSVASRSSKKEGGRDYVGQKVEELVKGKLLEACVLPVSVRELGTRARRQEEKLQVAENSWALTPRRVTIRLG